MDERRRYELYTVLAGGLEEGDLEAQIERIETLITNSGGEILETERKGRRRLAYQINRNPNGYDVIYQVVLPAEAPEAIERALHIQENVLRYLVVRREDLEKTTPEQVVEEES